MCCESKTKTDKTTTTTNPAWLDTASQDAVTKATALGNKPFDAYTGDRVADFTGDQTAGFDKVRDLVGSAPNLGPEVLDYLRQFIGAPAQNITGATTSTESVVDQDGRLGGIDRYMNPHRQQVIDPAVRAIEEQAAAQRKRINAGATSGHAFGDARHGILDSTHDQKTSTAIGDTVGNLENQAYTKAMDLRGQDLNRFFQSDSGNAGRDMQSQLANANLAETALNRGLTGATAMETTAASEQSRQLQGLQALLSTGAIQQGNDQQKKDAEYQEFLRAYGYDFDVLKALTSALSAVPHGKTEHTVGTDTKPDNTGFGVGGAVVGEVAKAALPYLITAM